MNILNYSTLPCLELTKWKKLSKSYKIIWHLILVVSFYRLGGVPIDAHVIQNDYLFFFYIMVFQNTEIYIRREKETPRRDEQDFHMNYIVFFFI